MKHKDVIDHQEKSYEAEAEDISLDKRIQPIACNTQEKEEVDESKYPVGHLKQLAALIQE